MSRVVTSTAPDFLALYMTLRTGRTCESSWCHKACLRQRVVRVVVRLPLTCVTLMPEAALIQADRRCLLEGNLLYTQAVLSQQGKAPTVYIFTEELLDKYPPLCTWESMKKTLLS